MKMKKLAAESADPELKHAGSTVSSLGFCGLLVLVVCLALAVDKFQNTGGITAFAVFIPLFVLVSPRCHVAALSRWPGLLPPVKVF